MKASFIRYSRRRWLAVGKNPFTLYFRLFILYVGINALRERRIARLVLKTMASILRIRDGSLAGSKYALSHFHDKYSLHFWIVNYNHNKRLLYRPLKASTDATPRPGPFPENRFSERVGGYRIL